MGIEADRLTRSGGMAPDAMILQLVENWLEQHPDSFVFDGFPRTITQAEAWEKMLADRNSKLDTVLFFDISEETIFERVMNRMTCSQCGHSFAIGLHVESAQTHCPDCAGILTRRSDDTPEALEQRLVEYEEKTEPLVKYYRDRGLLWTLTTMDRPEGVFREIVPILEGL